MPPLGQVVAFQYAQLLQEHRPLCPGRALVHLQPAVIHGGRFLHRGVPTRHVFKGQQPEVNGAAGVLHRIFGYEVHDAFRDGPLVESIPGRFYALDPTLSLPLFLGAAHHP